MMFDFQESPERPAGYRPRRRRWRGLNALTDREWIYMLIAVAALVLACCCCCVPALKFVGVL